MLVTYQQNVRRLIGDPEFALFQDDDLTDYINEARQEVAGASESIRAIATLTLAANKNNYSFSSAVISTAGVAGVLSVRQVAVNLSGSYTRLDLRPWEWLWNYYLSQGEITPAQPTKCAEYQPGVNGTLWFWPTPDVLYTMMLDSVGYPIPLISDATVEALSAPWTEAVQYYAAYFALVSANRFNDAEAMWARYIEIQQRATQMATPSVLPGQAPGGLGARLAGQHMPLTAPPPQGGR
jgi:hypothetical protein